MMKVLSIRQPWAHFIIHGGKDIENRSRHTKFRGRFLVQAALGMTKSEYADALRFCVENNLPPPPAFDALPRGGIIGSVELTDSLDASESPWYMGQKGYLLRDPKPLPFTPCKGYLGFFNADPHALGLDVANV